MKNEVFNGQRFWTYFKYDLTQMWRNHVKAAIGIGLSGLIVYVVTVGFSLLFGHSWGGPTLVARWVTFAVAGAALELYQTRTYGYLTDRRKGSAWLMNPASTFEKWLSMIIITIVAIPVLFLGTFLLSDVLVAAFDPTVGNSIVHSIGSGMRDLTAELTDINVEYSTTWSPWAFIPAMIAGFCCNYLFFLLCGLIFKKNKILGGFVIIFIFSSLMSIVMSLIDMNQLAIELEDFAQAESWIRAIFYTTSIVSVFMAAGIAGGIFWRLKTLKH